MGSSCSAVVTILEQCMEALQGRTTVSIGPFTLKIREMAHPLLLRGFPQTWTCYLHPLGVPTHLPCPIISAQSPRTLLEVTSQIVDYKLAIALTSIWCPSVGHCTCTFMLVLILVQQASNFGVRRLGEWRFLTNPTSFVLWSGSVMWVLWLWGCGCMLAVAGWGEAIVATYTSPSKISALDHTATLILPPWVLLNC